MLTGYIRCKLHYKTKNEVEIRDPFYIYFSDIDTITDTDECTKILLKTSEKPIKVYSPELNREIMHICEKYKAEKFVCCKINLSNNCYVEWEEEE